MITVVYNPLHSIGVPDGLAMSTAETIVDMKPGERVIIGTGLIVDAIRVMVKQGRADHTKIQFEFNGQTLPMDSFGHVNPWPEGFNDTTLDLLMQL